MVLLASDLRRLKQELDEDCVKAAKIAKEAANKALAERFGTLRYIIDERNWDEEMVISKILDDRKEEMLALAQQTFNNEVLLEEDGAEEYKIHLGEGEVEVAEEIKEKVEEVETQGGPVEIEMTEEGGAEVSFDPKVASPEGGDNHFRCEFMQGLRQIADENDIILIYDEVQTGVGVTGKMWAHQHFSNDDCSASQCKCGDGLLAVPDIISFGKKTQVCGILAGDRINEVENNLFRFGLRRRLEENAKLTLPPLNMAVDGFMSDVEAIANQHISITPFHLDLTHHSSLNDLKASIKSDIN